MHGDEAMMPESVEGRGGRDSVARWCAATCMTHGRLDARSSPSASRTPWPLVLALSLATTLMCQPLPIKTVIRVRVQVSQDSKSPKFHVITVFTKGVFCGPRPSLLIQAAVA